MAKEKEPKVKSSEEEFAELVKKLKKDKTKEELLEIVSKQPLNAELTDFIAARKALDELKVPYELSFK